MTEELHKYLSENLRLSSKTETEYYRNGYGEITYKDVTTIQLLLSGELISEVTT